MIGMVHKEQMRLSDEQEQWIVDWIIEQDHQGRAPQVSKVRQMVELLLRVQNNHSNLGKN